jgi:hypothetical protein
MIIHADETKGQKTQSIWASMSLELTTFQVGFDRSDDIKQFQGANYPILKTVQRGQLNFDLDLKSPYIVRFS